MSMPDFCNISVKGVLLATFEDDYHGKAAADLLLDFIESADEGFKVSFSYKESKSAYCVAITMPNARVEGATVCATFWAGELYDALLEAHIVMFHFEAARTGFYDAKSAIARAEKDLAKAFKRFSEEGNTPVTFKLIE